MQSGKLQSLAKLAESKLSSDQINQIAENIEDIKEFVDITTELGSMSSVLDYAKELLVEKKHFDYMRNIGESVELLFKEALTKEGIEAEIVHKGWGSHDFEVKNSKNGKSLFIEMKSLAYGSKDPIKLSIHQAQKAYEKPGDFLLCILERPVAPQHTSIAYLRSKLVYKSEIRDLLINALNDNNSFEKIRNRSGDVKLQLTLREDVRVLIAQSKVIDGSKRFDALITEIKERIN